MTIMSEVADFLTYVHGFSHTVYPCKWKAHSQLSSGDVKCSDEKRQPPDWQEAGAFFIFYFTLTAFIVL